MLPPSARDIENVYGEEDCELSKPNILSAPELVPFISFLMNGCYGGNIFQSSTPETEADTSL